MAQVIARDHHQVFQRMSHHHLHIFKIKKQSSIQKEEKVKSVSLGKSEGPISQIRGSGFDRTEITLPEEKDCSTSSSDDDDDDTDDEYDHEELLSEF
jgi:hypothetical protein